MKILAIGAHLCDLELGCAGTLIKHAQRGDGVYMMITDGSAGGEADVRSSEQLEAAKIIGAKSAVLRGLVFAAVPTHGICRHRFRHTPEAGRP